MNNSILEKIKKYCYNKSIVVIGNSSSILKKNNGKFIENHDIIVRINGACPINLKYYEQIGKRTDIYVVSYKSIEKSKKIIDKVKPTFTLRLNPSEVFSYPNCYFSPRNEYSELNSKFKNSNPSTGSMVINFFKKHIEYKELNIIGFDFFKSINVLNNKPNQFGSFLYKVHKPEEEMSFILSCLDEKTKIVNT